MLNYIVSRAWDNFACIKNKIFYYVGLHATLTTLPDYNIIIGELPSKESVSIETLKRHNVKYIVSLVTNDEYNSNFIHTPISQNELTDAGFIVLWYPIPDCNIPENFQINDIIDDCAHLIVNTQMNRENNNTDNNIYIHCRSGIGRAPLITLMLLTEHTGLPPHNIEIYLRTFRPEIHFSGIQRSFINVAMDNW